MMLTLIIINVVYFCSISSNPCMIQYPIMSTLSCLILVSLNVQVYEAIFFVECGVNCGRR